MARQALRWAPFVVVAALFGCSGPKTNTAPGVPTTRSSDSPNPMASAKPTEKAKPAGPIKVTAAEISKAFVDDKKAAAAKYPHGTVMEITGVIEAIHPVTDTNESGHIALEGHVKRSPDRLKPFTIGCGFGKDKNSPSNKKLASLKVGQTVTIRGTFDTFFDDWGRMTDDPCVLLDPKP